MRRFTVPAAPMLGALLAVSGLAACGEAQENSTLASTPVVSVPLLTTPPATTPPATTPPATAPPATTPPATAPPATAPPATAPVATAAAAVPTSAAAVPTSAAVLVDDTEVDRVDDELVAAVADALEPRALRIKSVRSIAGSGHDLDELEAQSPSGDAFVTVIVYRLFAPQEFAEEGTAEIGRPTGRAWISFDEPQLRSVYFQARAGFGVHVSALGRAGDDPAMVWLQLAESLAADQRVVTVALRRRLPH